jgi:hypothetical protein
MSYDVTGIIILSNTLIIRKENIKEVSEVFDITRISLPSIKLFMPKCIKCCKTNKEQHRFCPHCGTFLIDITNDIDIDHIECSSLCQFEDKVIPKTKGKAEYIVIYESGDSVYGRQIDNGKITYCTVEYKLVPEKVNKATKK